MKFLRFWRLKETAAWLHYVSFWLDYCGCIIQNTGCTLDVLYCLLLPKDHIITSNLQHGSYVGVRAVFRRRCLAVGLTSTKSLQSRLNIMIIWAFQCLTAIVMGQIMFYRKCGSYSFTHLFHWHFITHFQISCWKMEKKRRVLTVVIRFMADII